MTKLSVKSIKRENARMVLEAIARKKHITKLEISEETGLSLMTVGKIVNMLGAKGIILHAKKISKKAGRRAEVFRIRHDWLIPVFEISSWTFKFYIIDLEGTILDKVEYCSTNGSKYVANDFLYFLRQTLALLKNGYKKRKALGIGVSIAGIYDKENDRILSSMIPELSSFRLMQNITKIFKQKNVVIDNANRLCATGIIESLPAYESKSISCLAIGDCIECTTCDHGVYVRGGNFAGNFGDLQYSPGSTYANLFKNASNTADIANYVPYLLKSVMVAYDPDVIYLCSSKFHFTPMDTKKFSSVLQTNMRWPHIIPALISVHSVELESMSEIISRVISNWLDSIIE